MLWRNQFASNDERRRLLESCVRLFESLHCLQRPPVAAKQARQVMTSCYAIGVVAAAALRMSSSPGCDATTNTTRLSFARVIRSCHSIVSRWLQIGASRETIDSLSDMRDRRVAIVSLQ